MVDAGKTACDKLLKYYNKTTPFYCIASVLDPQINLEYFRREKWGEKLIAEWKDIMKDAWEREYKPPNAARASKPLDNRLNEDFVNSIYQKRRRTDIVDELEK
jgi:hypothetical protein